MKEVKPETEIEGNCEKPFMNPRYSRQLKTAQVVERKATVLFSHHRAKPILKDDKKNIIFSYIVRSIRSSGAKSSSFLSLLANL